MSFAARNNHRNIEVVLDRIQDAPPLAETGFHRQVAYLLTQPESREAFKSRATKQTMELFPQFDIGPATAKGSEISFSEMAHAAENPMSLKGMNADGDQIQSMLKINPNVELFDALKERDRSQAMEFAIHNTEVLTHALHETGDNPFQQELRLKIGAGVV